MSSFPPPYPYFLGIIYDSEYFKQTSSGSGLSISQANARYLQKTTPDIATALETFNAGIQTTTLSTSGLSTFNGLSLFNNTITGIKELTLVNTLINPSTTIKLFPKPTGGYINVIDTDLGTGLDTGNIVITAYSIEQGDELPLAIATGENVPLSVGTGLRNVGGVIHHYSDGDNAVSGSGVHLNNGVSNLSNTNIHNGINSVGNLNLASGSGSTTQIIVGNTSTTTALRGTTSIDFTKTDTILATSTGATASLYGNTTVGVIEYGIGQSSGSMNIATLTNRSGTINVGTGSTSTSVITIGNETINNTTTYLKGNTFISSPIMDTISANSTTSIGSLFNNINGAAINIGNGQTSPFGSIAIGNSASRAGGIAIGTGSSSTSQITIGNETASNTTTTIYGNTVITKPQINILAPTSALSNVFLYGGLSGGNLYLCANQVAGGVEIGSSATRTGAVEIAKFTKGNVNIATNMTAGTNTITIGTASLGTVVMRGAEVNLNTAGTGDVNICNLGGGGINIFQPISPFYNTPTALTQIGYSNRQAIAYTNINYSGGDRTYVWLAVSPGIYSVAYNSNSTATTNYMYTFLAKSPILPTFGGAFNSAGSTTYDESYLLNDTGVIGNVRMSATAVITTTASTTYIVLISNIFKSGSPVLGYGYSLVVTRIA
jgi:hypothetical protein